MHYNKQILESKINKSHWETVKRKCKYSTEEETSVNINGKNYDSCNGTAGERNRTKR
jgi:hypothetical protein